MYYFHTFRLFVALFYIGFYLFAVFSLIFTRFNGFLLWHI